MAKKNKLKMQILQKNKGETTRIKGYKGIISTKNLRTLKIMHKKYKTRLNIKNWKKISYWNKTNGKKKRKADYIIIEIYIKIIYF